MDWKLVKNIVVGVMIANVFFMALTVILNMIFR